LVTQDGPDSGPVWSPDGTKIAFESAMAKPFYFYANRVIAVVPAAGGPIDAISTAFDEDAGIVRWTPAGIYFSAQQRTNAYLFSIDPATRAVRTFKAADQWVAGAFSIAPDGRSAAFIAGDPSMMGELYASPLPDLKPRKLTDMNAQVAGWARGPLEVISW